MKGELDHKVHDIGDMEDTNLRIEDFLTFIEKYKPHICLKILEKLPGRVTMGVKWEARTAYPFITVETCKRIFDIIIWEPKLYKDKL